MQVLGAKNLITQPIYDTVQLAAAAGAYNFFAVPMGGILAGAVVKTYAHTNLVQAGRLEKGIDMTITAVSMYLRNTATGGAIVSMVDYETFYNNSDINVQIGQVSFLRLPAQEVPPGVGETQLFSNITPAATEFKMNHGTSNIFNTYKLENPLVLEDQESIAVTVTVGTALAAVTDLTIVMHGQQTRPVR